MLRALKDKAQRLSIKPLILGGLIVCAYASAPLSAQALDARQALAQVRLAQADVKAGDIGRALRRFEWLLFNDTDSVKRSKFYQDALRQLTAERPLSFGMSAAVLPSSNVTRSSSETIFHTEIGDFVIGDSEDDTSGVGLRLQANGAYTHTYALGREVSANLSFSSALYKTESLRSTTQKLTLAHRWREPGAQYTLSTSLDRAIYPDLDTGTSPNSWARGLAFGTTHMRNSGHQVSLKLSLSDRVYSERDYLDGLTTTLSASYSLPTSPRSRLTFLGGLATANLQAEHYSYTGYNLGASYSFLHQNGLSWALGYKASKQDYDDIFTGLSYARADSTKTVTASVSHRDIQIAGKVPRLSCSTLTNTSNVALYDYTSVDCSLTLQFDF